MTDAALTFEGVSKIYDIGRVQGSIGEAWQANSRRARRERVLRKALDDVSFTVSQGEAFAMIGDNGAGKTTALKVATRLVHPTSGTVRVRGRVGALIEVGNGLHPDLTGRENLRLFGRILGIPRHELSRSFDAIVDFAEIGEAIDQPVKQYSSGMQLRLGFAIAAHLEPDVLIVDEAIAVGDVGFQRKCTDRMAQLVRDGRTLIFVSHDLVAIEMLCRRAIHLDHGRIVADGPAADVVAAYLASVDARRGQLAESIDGTSGPLHIERITVHTRDGADVSNARSGAALTLRIHYRCRDRLIKPVFSVGITEGGHNPLFLASMAIDGQAPPAVKGAGYLDCIVDELPLTPNTYDVWLSVWTADGAALVEWQRIRRLVVAGERPGPGVAAASLGRMAPLLLPYRWAPPVEETGAGSRTADDQAMEQAPPSESEASEQRTEQRPA